MRVAECASDPAQSRGRRYEEVGRVVRGPRDAFQRDRDRIIHSIAFRRLRHKTQVFVAPDGDHYRVRLTHSIEVAQIGRGIARALGLNEDLTEALCLAHDIGHPPFGHAGEDALKAAMAAHGGFDHNGHTLRTLARLECPYPRFDGLNLTWETLEGLAKHNGPVTRPGWALSEIDADFRLDLSSHASLEAQIAAVADDIAYDNHDIDDGLRAGLLDLGQLMEQPFVAANYRAVEDRFPGAPRDRLLRELVRDQIGVMVNDVIASTQANVAAAGVASVEDVRAAGRPLGGFSAGLAAEERELKRFMYANLYHHPEQLAAAAAASEVIGRLFAAYADDPRLMGEDWSSRVPGEEGATVRHIGDYIAGMTDRFAIDRYADIFGRDAVPGALAHA
ncbi:deoxyguanosinetriphosphate triphosphohydrolase [Sphingopyxis macrogoltabida]|uniref:Deoxyguanosinetriphosphate triphosphohydrolase-like protein n=1 Tax=Sphingopyxis macrogoltabida TaxID=33050 RepID=A0AAC9AUG9_SPHMC|nr:deoxyguanosinetriphosphate triphosphohydrolase [Sphingopyxis macrogoltabida]ALJ13956.1 deoxyguanosinetriphosphate triphosphohydrolase [Sphingopyxis macrogoltabida]AMU88607.1 deoxyguanosinetriphosphate triphosphohydrolase [Sphingopyxis macrogoltabida]